MIGSIFEVKQKTNNMKKVVVLGGGGFIGGHLSKKLKEDGNHVRICDLKKHEYFFQDEICNEFIVGDLTDPKVVELVIEEGVDEVYQLAADMGGAMYIFTGQHDADVMYNSATINLNVVRECVKKKVGKVFYSSSACMYPEHNQLDPENPNCEESSAYPANPDSEYGWEKLFSERLFLAHQKNYGLDVKIARFHNIYGPQGTWNGGREKAPAAMCRKVVEAKDGDEIEVWGDGNQTRSFLYVDECVRAVLELMDSEFSGPVNIGSEEMVSINRLAEIAISVSGKNLSIKNLEGEEFIKKYGFKCPLGVKGRNSDNKLYRENLGSDVFYPLDLGVKLTYNWIKSEVDDLEKNTKWIYESPDGGKTIYKRKLNDTEKYKINK
jgi:nucleoside-diphosphate-sugar epimerase